MTNPATMKDLTFLTRDSGVDRLDTLHYLLPILVAP
jgi:hypothetical protein